MKPCEICRGDRVIKLIRYRETPIRAVGPLETATQETSYRIYPCPECAEKTDIDQVKLVRHYSMESFPSVLKNEPGYRESLLRHSSRILADRLWREGFIDFEFRARRSGDQPHYMDMQFISSIAVATRSTVASLNDREIEAQRALARPLKDTIDRLIDSWSIREDWIYKSQAKGCVDGGIKYVMQNLPFSVYGDGRSR